MAKNSEKPRPQAKSSFRQHGTTRPRSGDTRQSKAPRGLLTLAVASSITSTDDFRRSARAMHISWRSPTLKLPPLSSTGASSPPALRMELSMWAWRRASHCRCRAEGDKASRACAHAAIVSKKHVSRSVSRLTNADTKN